MSVNPSPELKSLFQAALDEFEKKSGINLTDHQVFTKLMTCQSVDSVIDVFKKQTKAFQSSRGDGHGKLMKWIKRIVDILHTLSTNNVLVGGVGLAFPPAKAIFGGIAILLSRIKDVSASYDALLDLFESFESFLGRLDTYTKIPLTTAMTEIVVKILIELFSTISLAIQHVKKGRLKKFGKKLLGENEIKEVLKRLDRLTLEEARRTATETLMTATETLTTATETLEVVYRLVKKMKVVMDDGRLLMDDIDPALVNLQKLASEINKRTRDELQEKVRRWLNPPDPSVNQNSARKAHHEGSAEWFLHGNTFPEWKAATGSLLWISGKPGSGKTILSSSIIEDLERSHKAELASIAFFYFDFKDDSKKNARGALCSLLIQLAAQSDAYSHFISALYSDHNAGSRQPNEYALRECFKEMLTFPDQGPIYIVLDAIDECPNSTGTPSAREEVLSLVKWLSELPRSRLSICITSRPEADIEVILRPLAYYTVSLHLESGQKLDITNYIECFIKSDPSAQKWRREDKEYVVKKLSERADGMFRWIFCQLDRLRRCLPPRIRNALDELPPTLDETYERTLLDIDDEIWSYAHRLFQCLVVALRPLRVEELAEFLAFEFEEEGTTTFRADWRTEDPSHVVLFTCSSLIAIVNMDGSAIVEFSHFSVKEYLTSTRIAKGRVPRYYIPLEPAHTIFTKACLSILLQFDDHITGESIKDFPLAGYAAQYWMGHAKMKNVLSDIEDSMKRLFHPRKSHFATWIWIYNIDDGNYLNTESPSPPLTTPLYIAALCGFCGVAKWLVTTCSQDVNVRGGRFDTPLRAACIMGSFGVAQFLLAHNADVSTHGWDKRTLLHDASKAGNVMVSQLLLNYGADIDAINFYGKTPLFEALEYGPSETSVEIAELLLGRGADPNFRDKLGQSPIYVALSRNLLAVTKVLRKYGADPSAKDDNGWTLLHLVLVWGQFGVAKRLLDLGVDVNSRDNRGQTPFQVALGRGQSDDVLRLLVDNGADPNVQDGKGWTPLHMASRSGKIKVIQRLLTLGVDVNSRDNRGQTPLHVAPQQSDDVLLLLLDNGADPNVQDDEGRTPLHIASRSGRIKAVQRLLTLGVDVNSHDNRGRTPLQSGLSTSEEDMLLLLLNHNAEPGVRDEDGQTPLHVASQEGRLEVVKRLLELGVDVNSRDNRGLTPLHSSLSTRKEQDIPLLLLNHNAEPGVRDEDGQTPLHVASQEGRLEVVKRLLELGVNVNSGDNRGLTPLHSSLSTWNEDIPLLLLNHNAEPGVRDEDGRTPLHIASRQGRAEVAKRLLELRVDVNSCDNEGRTPLHVASPWKGGTMARLLLNHGAELRVGRRMPS